MGLIGTEFDAFLRRMLVVLKPYLSDIVVIGGTANALYRAHPLAADAPGDHPGTTDLDLAAPRKTRVVSGTPLIGVIKAAGLEVVLGGHDEPPLMKFRAGPASPLEIEFLCPTSGAREEKAHLIQAGLSAQPIRHLDLLLHDPWKIDVSRVEGFIGAPSVLIPNPYCYVMQKILNVSDRGVEKRAKDFYYIYEVSVLFRDVLPQVARVGGSVRKRFPATWDKRFRRKLGELFADGSATGPTEAARIGRIASEQVQRSVERFIAAL